MIVENLVVSMFATNCYIAVCEETGEGIVIDPGAGAESIHNRIKAVDAKIKYIVNTHGHVDHVAANGKLKEKLEVPILLNRDDLELYKKPGFGLSILLSKLPEPDRFISEGDKIRFGNIALNVLETPGHTPGGVSLYGEGCVFTGDTLFAGSIGRTDLAGGSLPEILGSIKEKLLSLPDNMKVYPGHGPASTIGHEAKTNMFLINSSNL